MKKVLVALSVLTFVGCGQPQKAIYDPVPKTSETYTPVVRVFFNADNNYSVLIRDGVSLKAIQIGRPDGRETVILKTDVLPDQPMWADRTVYLCVNYQVAGVHQTKTVWQIHVHDHQDVAGGSWVTHDKFPLKKRVNVVE